MMRCLGLAQADIFRLFALEFIVIGLAACIIGMALGYATHYVLLNALGSLIERRCRSRRCCRRAGLRADCCCSAAAAGATAPRTAAARTAQDVGLPTGRVALGYFAGLVGFFALLLWSSTI